MDYHLILTLLLATTSLFLCWLVRGYGRKLDSRAHDIHAHMEGLLRRSLADIDEHIGERQSQAMRMVESIELTQASQAAKIRDLENAQ